MSPLNSSPKNQRSLISQSVNKLALVFVFSLALLVGGWSAFVANGATPTVPLMVNQDIDAELARTQILSGVVKLANPTQPGKLVVWGETAYSIGNYTNQDRREPMIAAAGWGAGRVIAMGDHQWLSMDSYGDKDDSGRFYKNSLAWLANSTEKSIKIVVTQNSSAETWLGTQGYTNVVKLGGGQTYATELADADVLVGWLGSTVAQSDLDLITTFVTSGGGLFIVDYGIGYTWWWGKEIPDAPGNILLRDAGIGFSSDWPNGTLEPTRAVSQTTGADVADIIANPGNYSQTDKEIATLMLRRLYQILPADDPLILQLDASYAARINSLNPTPTNPVSDLIDQALLSREGIILWNTPAREVTVHRVAEEIYGSVPVTADRVMETVTLDTTISRWHPTGLFAAAGEVITVTVPASMVGQGFKVRINAHSDNISPRSSWERPPLVHRAFDINAAETEAANGFGGLIFIDFGNSPANIGMVDVKIENAVRAPYFDVSKHTDAQWTSQLRDYPAPFGVLVSENMIIVVPKRHIESADLTEPTALMNWWSETVRLQDDVADQTQFRTSPELANVDVQISAGSAHSGYPYQAYEKHWGNMVDWDRLQTSGSWGDFHELGHNHQRGWWTFDGDVEVSVNIFSNIALETMVEEPPPSGWGYSADPVANIIRANVAVMPGGTYSSKSQRWPFWFQLADGFGWETYKAVFTGYEDDNKNDKNALPATDLEEKEQWLVRWSKQVGYDLSPFMVGTWGLLAGQAALDEITHLPKWMPIVSEVHRIVPKGGSAAIDFKSELYAMNGVTLTAVSDPSAGNLVDQGADVYRYSPTDPFAVADHFLYTAVSDVGNTETFTATFVITDQGVLQETWFGVVGGAVADLTSDPAYPDSPDGVAISPDFEAPSNIGNSYGVRMRAWLRPPTTGDYTFYIASNNAGSLLLSSDDTAANGVQIAKETNSSTGRGWNDSAEQKSITIQLEAGKRYYIEALMKENGSSDHLSVAWEGPGIAQQLIEGKHLRPYVPAPNFQPPTAVDDAATVDEEGSSPIDVLANDYDVDRDPISLIGTTQGSNGAVIFANGVVTYTPAADFFGVDMFTYTISDTNDGVTMGTVTVTVTNLTDDPVPADDSATTAEDTPVAIYVLANDIDPDNDPLSVVGVTVPANGTAVYAGDTVTYTPNVNYFGPDSFMYSMSDGINPPQSATVSVTVTAVNDPPVTSVSNVVVGTMIHESTVIDALANFTDPENDTLSVTAVSTPTNGTVTQANGMLTYTPNDGFEGQDSFTYTVGDGNGGENAVTVTVTVSLSGQVVYVSYLPILIR